MKNALGIKLPFRDLLPKILVLAFFSIVLWIGVSIHKDFGLQADSVFSFNRGQMTYDYIMNFDESQGAHFDTHGWVFDAVVYFIQMGLNLSDSSVLFQTKHLMTFLMFFAACVFFYFLCRDHFGSWRIGLMGSLFLVLSPRIFAHAFYNPKDSPCLDFFIISIYTLIWYLEKKTYSRAAVHALACSVLVAIRNVGILVPVMTGLFVAVDLICIHEERRELRRVVGSAFLFTVLSVIFVVLLWPILWQHPWDQFVYGFNEMKRYGHLEQVIYVGKRIYSYDIPWHYIPVWIAISTPLVYVILFVLGACETFRISLIRDISYAFKRNTVIFTMWLFVPIGAVICFHSVIYNAWRQMLFVYPGLLIFSLMGIVFMNRVISELLKPSIARFLKAFIACLIAISLIPIVSFMIRFYPIQDVYFNELVGGVKGAKYRFDLDYWGVSYCKALEYILEHDSRGKIRLCSEISYMARTNALILPPQERDRLDFVNPGEAEYILSSSDHFEKNSRYQEIYSLKVEGAKIVTVYKLS